MWKEKKREEKKRRKDTDAQSPSIYARFIKNLLDQ